MLKKIVYWAYLSRVFTGLISGRDHWLHGFGPIWATLLPLFSLNEYLFIKLTGGVFDFPWHIVLSGAFSVVIAIAADVIEAKKGWTEEFSVASEMPVRTRAILVGVVSIIGFFVYLSTVIFLFDEFRAIS